MADRGYLSETDFASVVRPHELYTVLHGNIVAVGFDPETGGDVSLTDAQVEKVTDYFTAISAPGSGALAQFAIAAAPERLDLLEALNDELGGFFDPVDASAIALDDMEI